jgi:hypothetical protein
MRNDPLAGKQKISLVKIIADLSAIETNYA